MWVAYPNKALNALTARNSENSNLKNNADYRNRIYIENSDFVEGIFAQIPRVRRGFEKSPRAPRRARGPERRPERGAKRRTEAGAEARGPGGVPEGIFQIPERTRGSGRKSTKQNPNFEYIFFLFVGTNSKIAYMLLSNLKRRRTEIFSIYTHYTL